MKNIMSKFIFDITYLLEPFKKQIKEKAFVSGYKYCFDRQLSFLHLIFLFNKYFDSRQFIKICKKQIKQSKHFTVVYQCYNIMFKNNQLTRSAISLGGGLTCGELISKEIVLLKEKKQQIQSKIGQFQSKRLLIQKINQQIQINKECLQNLDEEIQAFKQKKHKQQLRLNLVNQQILEIVIGIQDKQMSLENEGKALVSYFKYELSQLDSIRLKLIQIQNNDDITAVQHCFCLRKSIIQFLRGCIDEKCQFRFGVELEISKLRKSDQFRQFILDLIKSTTVGQISKRLFEHLQNYIFLLKQAQQLLEEHQISQNQQNTLSIAKNSEQKQIMKFILKTKREIKNLENKLKIKYAKQKQLKKQLQNIQTTIQQTENHNISAKTAIDDLIEKKERLIANYRDINRTSQELLQVSQAIQYLTNKCFNNQNINSNNHSQVSIKSAINIPIHPLELTEVNRQQCEKSIVKKTSLSKKSLHIFKSPPRMMPTSTRNRLRINSPNHWK